MIHFTKDAPDHETDAAWLNREIKEHLGSLTFTKEQEAAIKKLIVEICAGYNHTISRMNWGPGWD